MSKVCIVWFRQDLRLHDNPSLYHASKEFEKIIPIYIYDEKFGGGHSIGGASKWWLHHSLKSLSNDIDISIFEGDAIATLKNIIKETGATAIYFNRCYEPFALKRDEEVAKLGIEVKSYNGSLLFEPNEVQTTTKDYFKVFTPFWKACIKSGIKRSIYKKPVLNVKKIKGVTLESLNLLPKKPNWAKGFEAVWECGENAAIKALDEFIEHKLSNYGEGRNYPAKALVSRMSPHLHFGEISPLYIFTKIVSSGKSQKEIEKYTSELGWREFSYNLLGNFPNLSHQNFKSQFDNFTWEYNTKNLNAWKKGQTGYPIVDAGMRELWQTGYMHNRVRMIVASFLIKHLLIDWREGERWFWDTLVDADMANNCASWQWVAGSGADAAPYFRIFNPIIQSEKFDKDGQYIKRYVPELKDLDSKNLHAPWEASPIELRAAGVILGQTYPHPIVDHNKARAEALRRYKRI